MDKPPGPAAGHYPAPLPVPHGHGGAEGITLQELLAVVWRRKFLVGCTAFVVAVAAFALALTRPPVYEAEARVLLEDGATTPGVLGELSMLSSAPPAEAEIEVFESREIVRKIVRPPGSAADGEPDLGVGLTLLVDDLDRYAPWALLRDRFAPRPLAGALHVEVLGDVQDRRDPPAMLHFPAADRVEIRWESLLGRAPQEFPLPTDGRVVFEGLELRLSVTGDLTGRSFRVRWSTERGATERTLKQLSASETARGSGVVRIRYQDSDPGRAAAVVNNIVRAYIARNRERLSLRAKTTVQYIESQVERIRSDLTEAEKELVAFQEESGAALLTENAGAVVDRMSQLDLDRARLALIIENQERLVAALDQGAPVEDVIGTVEVDPAVAEMLKELSGLLVQEALLAEEHTDEWPPLREVRAQIRDLRARMTANARARAESMRRQDATLQESLDRYQRQVDAFPATERELAKFQRKAQSFEQIFTFLLEEEQRARIAESAAIPDVTVVDWAVPPTTRTSPRLTLSALVAGFFGLILGGILALWRDSATRKVTSTAQMEALTGLPPFGTIPNFRRGRTRAKGVKRGKYFLAVRDAPSSPAAEAYRGVRAQLGFAAKMRPCRSVAITSATQGEGKSTTVADLALALAAGGKKVLLVDADLRRPIVHKLFDVAQAPGLADVLRGEPEDVLATVRPSGVANLDLVPSGAVGDAHPGDLLALPLMGQLVERLAEGYDYVFYDVPPVLAVADAAAFLNHLDGILFLVRHDFVPEAVVAASKRRLELAGAPLLGSILNGLVVDRRAGKYGKGYYGYYSSYGYGGAK